jgi:hypothetical protein
LKGIYDLTIVVTLALIKAGKDVPISEIMFFRCFFRLLPSACGFC